MKNVKLALFWLHATLARQSSFSYFQVINPTRWVYPGSGCTSSASEEPSRLDVMSLATCWLGASVSCSSSGPPSSQTPASPGCTPAYTAQRTLGPCTWWETEGSTSLLGHIIRCGQLWGLWHWSCRWDNTHHCVRQSFSAAFSSRHLNAMKKPDSLQQWLKAGGRRRRERGFSWLQRGSGSMRTSNNNLLIDCVSVHLHPIPPEVQAQTR